MLASLKKYYKNILFNLSANNSSFYRGYYRHFYTPRKGSLAEIIDAFSKSKNDIVFVQVGANDGFFHDPLHKFIKRDNWRGVLLEPQTFVFNRFLKRLHKNNPRVQAVNAALDIADGEKTIYKIAFSQARWATGLTSFRKEVIEEAIDSGHVERCAKRYGDVLPASREQYIAQEKIQCVSLPTLLSTYSLRPIDWLQIDAEGYDYEIIKMFDIEKTQPEAIVFEHSHLSDSDRQACETLLRTNGYSIGFIGENTVAMKNPVAGVPIFS